MLSEPLRSRSPCAAEPAATDPSERREHRIGAPAKKSQDPKVGIWAAAASQTTAKKATQPRPVHGTKWGKEGGIPASREIRGRVPPRHRSNDAGQYHPPA